MIQQVAVPGRDILIVDDDIVLGELLADELQNNGYSIDLAANAAAAKALLRGYRYSMVIVDWRLPDGDGAVIANLAEATGSHAFVMSGYLKEMLPGSVDIRQTIMKPVRPSELLATVRACIGDTPRPK